MNRHSQSNGLQTASGLVAAHPLQLTALEIITDGTHDVTVTAYDNDEAAASGTVLFQGTLKGPANFGGAEWEKPVIATKGLYIAMSGTGGKYIGYTEI